jgi:outer membrane protein assembly factor BamD
VAAANRAQTAVTDYREAPAVEEALFIMVRAYDALGLTDLRNDAERVLRKNFPDSVYFRGGPQQNRSWWQFWK